MVVAEPEGTHLGKREVAAAVKAADKGSESDTSTGLGNYRFLQFH